MKKLLLFVATILISLTFAGSCLAQSSETGAERSSEDSTKITLTIGETVIPAVLHDTAPARDLIERLPVTVSLNRGQVDYCGSIENPSRMEKMMYRQGIITAIWPIGFPARIL